MLNPETDRLRNSSTMQTDYQFQTHTKQDRVLSEQRGFLQIIKKANQWLGEGKARQAFF